MKEANVFALFMTRQTIDWIRVRIDDVCEFSEVGVAVCMLDKGVSVPMRFLYSFQPLQKIVRRRQKLKRKTLTSLNTPASPTVAERPIIGAVQSIRMCSQTPPFCEPNMWISSRIILLILGVHARARLGVKSM